MISPQLRMTIGTTGTPACMAMKKGPFLNGSSRLVGDRVPSGAIAMDRPDLSASTTGSSCSCAFAEFAAVDVGHVGQVADRAEHGVVLQLLLGDPGEVRAQQRTQHEAHPVGSGG